MARKYKAAPVARTVIPIIEAPTRISDAIRAPKAQKLAAVKPLPRHDQPCYVEN